MPDDAPEGLCPSCLAGSVLFPVAIATTVGERLLPQLANYECLEVLGQGSMGVVFRARQKGLNRTVAVKMILSGNLATPAEVRRFEAEARAAAKLQHPHLVPIHEVGESEGRHFYSMDFVDGANLATVINGTPLAPRRAVRYMIGIAGAVQYAHEQRIVHRDLKPANILIDHKDEPRITDFGLAREFSGLTEATASDAVAGTPAYMAPEQAAGKKTGPAADIYALGAVLYEMLAGRPPFKAETALLTLRQVLDAEPVSPRALNSSVPKDLDTICLKCLQKNPAQRYATSADLIEDLLRFERGEPIAARRISRLERGIRWCNRHPGYSLPAGGILLLLVFLSLAAVFVRKLSKETNAALAVRTADLLRLQMDRTANCVAELAADPEFGRFVQVRNSEGLAAKLRQADKRVLLQSSDTNIIGNWAITDAKGLLVLRAPDITNAIQDRSFRLYFRGAMEAARRGPGQIYLSPVYRSLDDGDYKFSIACAVFDAQNPSAITGVVNLMIKAQSTAQTLRLSSLLQETVIVGKFDSGRLDGTPAARAADYVLWLHPAFTNGHPAVPLVSWRPKTDNFAGIWRDPAARFYPSYLGPFVAGVAPVPGTDFLVIVQTRDWVALALCAFAASMLLILPAYAIWRFCRVKTRSGSLWVGP